MADTLDQNSAVSWAGQSLSGKTYPGLCDRYVANAYGQAHSGYETALTHWALTPQEYRHPGDNKPPVGALVFWKTGAPAGHVAIVTSYTKAGQPVITTTHVNNGRPTQMLLSQAGMNYQGWATPYFQGRTAPLKSVSNTDYTTGALNTNIQTGDQTGIDNRPDAPLAPDPLSPQEMASRYGMAWRILGGTKELKDLFILASKEQWTADQVKVKVQDTQWFAKNAEYAREAWVQQKTGGADWTARQKTAALAVQAEADKIGAVLTPEDKAALTTKFIFDGWDKPGRGMLLTQHLTENINGSAEDLKGQAGVDVAQIRVLSDDYGVQMTDKWYVDKVKQLALGKITETDIKNMIIANAKSTWSGMGDKINDTVSVKDLASSYIQTMANVWETDPDQIDLKTPEIKNALTYIDAGTGQPRQKTLWEFEQGLRKDPRWDKTQTGQKELGDASMQMLKDFGFWK